MKNRKIYLRILQLIAPYRYFVVISLVFAMLSVILTLYVPVLIGRGIDVITGKGQANFGELFLLLLRLAIVSGLTALFQWLMNLCNNKVTFQVVKDIRTQAFTRLAVLPLKYLDDHPYGEIISKMITDVDQLSEGLMLGFSQLFVGTATILGTLFFMMRTSMKITAVVVVITPLSFFVAGFIAKRTFFRFREQAEARGEMTALVEEMVGNQKVVKAFSHEAAAIQSFEEINKKLGKCSLKAIFFSSLTNPSTRFVNGLVYAGVGIFGAISAIRGNISVGQLSCFLTYANQYTKPFNEISSVITEFQNAVASAGRVIDFIDQEVQVSDFPEALELTEKQVDGRVWIDEVAFSYHPETPLIEHLNLRVNPGERIAVVGPTGCGKTTMINLLMRFYDVDAGLISVSGHPVKQISRDSLRRSYGMVLQETWLKSGSIAENIAYGKPSATRAEIVAAAKAVHADHFISRLPSGYDTRIGEFGGSLSQGQKQQLCIARVMLCLPSMLILDEATSSIDTRTEIQIQQTFAKMMKGRTSFIVAHRLSTVKEADVILVMKNGRVVEQGKHEELLEKKGFYAKLYHAQFSVL